MEMVAGLRSCVLRRMRGSTAHSPHAAGSCRPVQQVTSRAFVAVMARRGRTQYLTAA